MEQNSCLQIRIIHDNYNETYKLVTCKSKPPWMLSFNKSRGMG